MHISFIHSIYATWDLVNMYRSIKDSIKDIQFVLLIIICHLCGCYNAFPLEPSNGFDLLKLRKQIK